MEKIAQEKTAFFRDVWSRLTVPVRPGPEGLDLYRTQIDRFAKKKRPGPGSDPGTRRYGPPAWRGEGGQH